MREPRRPLSSLGTGWSQTYVNVRGHAIHDGMLSRARRPAATSADIGSLYFSTSVSFRAFLRSSIWVRATRIP